MTSMVPRSQAIQDEGARHTVSAPSFGEEIASSITHGIGLIASLSALPFLVVAGAHAGPWSTVGFSVFGATLILLYSASTLYHALPPSRAKRVFRILDHAAIYLLIAGTYTPFTLGPLRGAWGWTLFGVIWCLAALGVVFKSTLGIRYPIVSTAVYVAMGWLILIAAGPLVSHVAAAGVRWLVVGGVCYTAGVAFFAWQRLRYGHALWHLCVAAGSACHFVAVLRFAVGPVA